MSFATKTMNGAYWRGHMTIGGLPSPHSLTGFLRYFRNVSQGWPVSWMAPTCSICQEMVSIYLIKIKITTKFFKSAEVVRFGLGPLFQGQMRTAKLKVFITRLLLILEVCNVKPTYRKSWDGNLLMWTDLTLVPSFKAK